MEDKDLKVLVMPNCKSLGEKINNELNKLNKTDTNYLVNFKAERFSNGEGKVKILEDINNADLYILSDTGNYDITYNFHERIHYMSPDEHFEDIKRVISATSGNADKINVVMPLLYQSRQHKRKGRESLDCANALQELQNIGINRIITFDAHDPSVCNAIPRLPFENFYPTHRILEDLIKEEEINDLLVISPDMGAMERARYYADMIDCDVGVFYKRRDLSKVVNGKNPIVEHMYMGADPKEKDVIIVDDMIASGGSILEVAENLRERGVDKIFLIATFSLFTEGIEKFVEAYEDGLFTKLYSTNLTYVPNNIIEKQWYHEVDCSKYLALIINSFYHKENIEATFNNKKKMFNKIQRKKEKENKQTQLVI